jgi:hypothetical protein
MSNVDVDRLLHTLENSDLSTEETEWLREQLGSKELQDGLRTLVHAVFVESFCPVCIENLPYYVHLEAMGEDTGAEYPRIKAHLDLCEGCRGEYAELREMVFAAHADEALPAPSYPQFDLPFERPGIGSARARRGEPSPPGWLQLWEDVTSAGARLHRLATEVALSLADPFAELAAPLRPALVSVPALAHRGREWIQEEAETIKVLDLEYPPANLLIRIGRGPVVAQRTALVIDVLRTEPSEPIPATRVALLDEQHRLMEQIGTDANGSVCFDDVGVGRYFVQVRHAKDTWEFPLVVSDTMGETPQLLAD